MHSDTAKPVTGPADTGSGEAADGGTAEAADGGTDDAAPRTSRAGRNLPAAIGVGVALGAMLIVVLVFVPTAFVGVAAVAVAIASWEVTKRLREQDVLVPRIPLLVGGQAIIWFAWPFGALGSLSAFAGTAAVTMVWRLLAEGISSTPRNFLRDTSVSIFVVAWLPLLASFATLMTIEDDGGARILTLMIAVVCSDVGGYAAGVLFGKHPMAPAISPKKSWEGLAGSIGACVIGCLLTVTLLLQANSLIGIVLGVAVAASATLGDLIESQVKRDLGIKDMGTMLPGHGGIMDRLDSVLPSVFVTWLVLAALV